MRMLADMASRFRQDEDGAAMVEYSILVGIIAAASILAIVAIGGWAAARFVGLCANLDASSIGACDPVTGVGS